MKLKVLVWIAALVAQPAVAQRTPVPVDPADGKAVSPMLAYQSPFAGYRAWREPEPMNWRTANDEAGAMGGHMGHVRGRAGEMTSPSTASAPGVKPVPSK